MMLPTLLVLTALACPQPSPVGHAPKPTVSKRISEVGALASALAHQPRFTGRAVGYGGTKSPAFVAFEALLDVAEDSDLEGLLSAQSPVVRLYAFWGLLQRGHARDGLLSRLSKPSQKVQVRWGCFGGVDTVAGVAHTLTKAPV